MAAPSSTTTAVEATTSTTAMKAAATMEAATTLEASAAMGYVSALTVEAGLSMEAGPSVPISAAIATPAEAAAIAVHKPTVKQVVRGVEAIAKRIEEGAVARQPRVAIKPGVPEPARRKTRHPFVRRSQLHIRLGPV